LEGGLAASMKQGLQKTRGSLGVFVVLLLFLSALPHSASASASVPPIKHVVVIVEENHTFDNYFGTYPGANGVTASEALPFVAGGPSTAKPHPLSGTTVPMGLCNSARCARTAYDNGKMDGFVIAAGTDLTMGYFDYHQIPYYWDYASQFVLMDNFFTSVMAPSLPNHLYLIAGQSGGMVDNSRLQRLNFTSSTVGNSTFYFRSVADELEASHVSWKYYAGDHLFLNNWNPLPAFASFRGNATMLMGLAESSQFLSDLAQHALPSVSWVMPGNDQSSEHPPYDITTGEKNVVSVVNAVMASSYWNSTAVFVTWDDWGGWYDHVPPPQVDHLGYGFRVPCLIISPYAREGFVDHTQADFTSILKFIETTYSLHSLTARDAAASDLMEAFDFSQKPHESFVLPGPFVSNRYPLTLLNGTVYEAPSSNSTGPIIVTSTVSASSSSVTQLLPQATWLLVGGVFLAAAVLVLTITLAQVIRNRPR
jgi:phospholipase C